MKQKYILILICLLLLLCLVSCMNLQSQGQYFLVQIIPGENQENTSKLVDSLNLYLSNLLANCQSLQEINDEITNNWEEIEKLLDNYGTDYSAKITSKTFSEIVFDNQTLHKGEYTTLVINFGKYEEKSQFLLYSSTTDNGKTPIIKSRILENL